MKDDETQGEAFDEEDVEVEAPEIPKDDIGHLKAAFRVLASKQGKKAEEQEEMHSTRAAQAIRADVGQLDTLMPRVLDEQGVAGLTAKQRELGRTAIAMYVKNLKALRGTCLGCSRSDWATEAEDIAADVEGRILPLLDEQKLLPDGLEPAKQSDVVAETAAT